jgi:ferredoxin
MTYRIELDTSLCSGFGACVSAAPRLFRLELDGRAVAVVYLTEDAAVHEAVAACPMGAISVIEERAA